jgi:hypothetical protein
MADPLIPPPQQTQQANIQPAVNSVGSTIPVDRPIIASPTITSTKSDGTVNVPGAPNYAPAIPTPITPPVAPRSEDDIYHSYVTQGQGVLDAINSSTQAQIQAANLQIDQGAAKAQQDQNALAAITGGFGSSSVSGANAISQDATGKKGTADAQIQAQNQQQVAQYLTQIQTAAQNQSNFELQNFPTYKDWLQGDAGKAFQGLAASGVNWDSFSTSPQFAQTYQTLVQAFGGDPNIAKASFIAAAQGNKNSTYVDQPPIVGPDGSLTYFKQVTQPDGTTKVVPDTVDLKGVLKPGQSVLNVGGQPYTATTNADGTVTLSSIVKSGANAGSAIPITPISAADSAAQVQAFVTGIQNGTITSIAQVPAQYKSQVATAMAQQGTSSPLADSRYTNAVNRVVANYIALPGYQLTANGLPYLQRIQAAEANPGSISDQDLLDSLTKLNTAGNALSDAQVKIITDGQSYSDWANVLSNKLGNGGVLSDSQRQQISTLASSVYKNYQQGYQPIYDQVTSQLRGAQIPEDFWTIPDLNTLYAGQTGTTANAGGSQSTDSSATPQTSSWPGF